MLERLLIAAALIALLVAVLQAGRWWYTWRNRRIERRLRQRAEAERISTAGPVHPRIVYFTTQTCVVCKAQQEPALNELLAYRGDIVVERHDAVEDRDLADEYGVLSVPTTAVYDAFGRLVTVNRGFVPAALLLAQVSGTEPAFEGGIAMPSEPLP